jgi:hypothetical protein
MDKNVGKTTVLNHIINKTRGKVLLGLTSIGRDGEDKDRVTGTEKPRIYIESGTLIATAKECLCKGDITREILETTGINTPMGEVVIAKALSDGYVELGGPSINAYMKTICDNLYKLGGKLILVDGALSRTSLASPAITEGCILSTGASLNRNINNVVEMTRHTVELLSLEKEADREVLSVANSQLSSSRIAFIYKNKRFKELKLTTALEASKSIVENLNNEVSHILIRGVITDKLLVDVIKSTDKYKGVTILVEEGTKLFIGKETFYKFQKLGGVIKTLEKINLICLTCNPKSPYGYEFEKDKFLKMLKEYINLPVLDVVGGG